jgi:hypothetical protein
MVFSDFNYPVILRDTNYTGKSDTADYGAVCDRFFVNTPLHFIRLAIKNDVFPELN